jgi:alpha-galactosidase
MAQKGVKKIIEAGRYAATVSATTDRRKALEGADAVLSTILCGDIDVWQHDILIPNKFGVDTNVGDTRGPSGIFRALRTIPEMVAICRDIEALCPDALMLNYTNPMAMLCQAMQKHTKVHVTGLCHSVQGTAWMLSHWLKIPYEELTYTCAGINHLSWYTKLEHKGKDVYPALRALVRANKKIYNEEQVRNEMFLMFDYYVTESSGHNSEYNWWFRKRPDLIKQYCTSGTGWNPGHSRYILDQYLKGRKNGQWKKWYNEWLDSPDWKDPEKLKEMLKRHQEYASYIINAWVGGDIFQFNGNVLNTQGLVSTLPRECCVEVPVLASRVKLQPIATGALPTPVVPLTSVSALIEMMAVEGCMTGDARLVYQAICNDPLTAAVLGPAEIRRMVKAMFDKNKPYLPTFKKINLGY